MKDLAAYAGPSYSRLPAFRVGIVREQDPALAKVRVVFPDYDNVISWWLPVVFAKTKNDKSYWLPDVGEQVVCLMDVRDEDGAVLGAIYSSEDPPPASSADVVRFGFRDGTSVEYDRGAHLLEFQFNDGAEIKYDGGNHSMSINLPEGANFQLTSSGAQIEIDTGGNVTIRGAGQVQLGSGEVAGVARLGDLVQVQDSDGGTLVGRIVTASSDVVAG
ncbi:MAG: phage baseplate assembly protein V [Candidatus Binatus sp.]|uniref:phage baseplate assembly protein V n=1 Tax=Candidatus Binatus sp. TaxID=2811406 RepID=UPI0027219813|nr:phage baseplate assembly protein V [Candidatus Binatus sp.]MDO8433506.1 phage baseplate assembly protein V [Candidatus Binatus sp.]